MTRKGKIARLPHEIREELNRRLQGGGQGKRLVAWLNALPQVRRVLAEDFGGKPIREQSLSEWRKGGYRDWLARQEAADLAGRVTAEAGELQAEATEPLTEKLAPWLAARYCVAAKALLTQTGAVDRKALHEMNSDVAVLRRGDQNAAWLRLERERVELRRAQSRERREKRFWEWAQDPENRVRICGLPMTEQERRRRMLELFGVEPKLGANPDTKTECAAAPGAGPPDCPNQGESRLIKPNQSG